MGRFLKGFFEGSMARSTLAMLVSRALSIFIGISLSVLLARWLAPDGYGSYLFTLTIAQFLAMPILAGLPALVVREVAIARGSDDASALAGIVRWSAGFIVATFVVVSSVAVLFLTIRSTHSEDGLSIYLIALPLVLSLAFLQMWSAVVQGCEHPFAGSLGDGLIRPVILLGLVFLLATSGTLNPQTALWSHVAAAAAGAGFAFGYWFLVCRRRGFRQSQPVRYENQKWLLSLLPLSLVTAASLINSRLDVLMLGILSIPDDVAHYGIAVQVAGLVVMGQTIVNTIVAPKIARLYRLSDNYQLQVSVTRAARLSTVIALAVLLFVAIFGADFLDLLLGEDYSSAWGIAIVLCCGNLVASAMGPVGKVMSMTGNERSMVRLVWVSAGANAFLNLSLIPLFGALGAATATVSALLVHQALMVRWVYLNLNIATPAFMSLKKGFGKEGRALSP